MDCVNSMGLGQALGVPIPHILNHLALAGYTRSVEGYIVDPSSSATTTVPLSTTTASTTASTTKATKTTRKKPARETPSPVAR